MSDPIKVTLPPWRRGDGKPCKAPGEYRARIVGVAYHYPTKLGPMDLMFSDREYVGPIEFIETKPELELIRMPNCRVVTFKKHNRWICRQEMECDSELLIHVSGSTPTETILANNAAVRVLQGTKE